MLYLKLARLVILACLLAVLCATSNAGVAESTVQICCKPGTLRVVNVGTGFTWNKGYVMTAKHVVEACRGEMLIRDHRGTFHPAYVYKRGDADWAIVQCPSLIVAPLPVRSNPVVQGEFVTAYGDFRGFMGEMETAGGFVRDSIWQGSCQNFTGDVRPGYSGGPVVDMNGNVVGITSWENTFTNHSGFVRVTDVLLTR